jgi:hypothetical protein
MIKNNAFDRLIDEHETTDEPQRDVFDTGKDQANIAELKRLQRMRQNNSADPAEVEALNSQIEALQRQLTSALVKEGDTYRFRRFQMTKLAVIPPQDLTQEEADEFGMMLAGMDDALNWWRGDWANYYIAEAEDDNERGEIYDQLADVFGMKSKTVRNCAYVARKVDPSRRRDTLSFSHHVEVGKLSPTNQLRWLNLAEIGNEGKRWSVSQLRKAIKDALDDSDPPTVKHKMKTHFQSVNNGTDKLIKQGADPRELIDQYQKVIDDLKKLI